MGADAAAVYDAIYSYKDYAGEAARLRALIAQGGQPDGASLLDVGCGTGQHLRYLGPYYAVEGLDRDGAALAVARQQNPGVPFHQGDMTVFDLGRQFDVVVCLFGAVAYVHPLPRFCQAVQAMRRHVRPGGLLLIEQWIAPEAYAAGQPGMVTVDQPDFRLARLHLNTVRDGIAVMDFHFLLATPAGVEYFIEHHEIGLYSEDDYLAAFAAAGLTQVRYDFTGLLTGQGMFIAVVPPEIIDNRQQTMDDRH